MSDRALRYEAVLNDPAASFLWRDFIHKRMKVHWHYHPEVEINYIEKGSGLRFVGDAIEHFHGDELYLFGADTPHAWHAPPRQKAPVETICIQFLPANFGNQFLTLPEMRRVNALFRRAKQGMLFHGKAHRRCVEALLRMRAERRGSLQRLSGLLTVLGMMAETSEYSLISDLRFDPELDESANRNINTVFSTINQRLHDIPSQAEIAKLVRLSAAAFSRFFRRCVGKPFIQYISELRISLACRDLIESEKNVTEIAYASGFNTLSNFNHQFKRLHHMTPREYRRTFGCLNSLEQPLVKWRRV